MRIQRPFEQIQQREVRDVTFDEFSALVEERGFRFERMSDGYWVFVHSSRPGTLAVQARDGRIESFRALYLLRILEKHDPAAEE